MREFIVEADGGSRGNPGPAGYGAVVKDAATGETLVEAAEYIGTATNNVAEYRGLLAGLRAAHELDPAARVRVRMDSKLVVEQMSGRWKIKHPGMKPLAAEAKTVFPPSQITFEWIPREQNKHADRLANEAMDAGRRGEQWAASRSSAELGAGPSGPTVLVPSGPPGDAAAGAARARAAMAGAASRGGGGAETAAAAGRQGQAAADLLEQGVGQRPGAVASEAAPGATAERGTVEGGARSDAGRHAGVGAPPYAEAKAGAGAQVDAGTTAGAVGEALGGAGVDVRAKAGAGAQAGVGADAGAGAGAGTGTKRGAVAEAPREVAADVRAKAGADVRAARSVAVGTPPVGWAAPPDLGAPATLVLLRHGETPLTREKRFSGSGGSDPALSDAGRAQADRVAAALAARGTIQAVVSSPLRRCRETAGIVATRLGLEVSIEEGLRETDFGAWEGLTFAEVRDRYPDDLNAWLASAKAAPTGGGESFAAVTRRVAATRDKLITAYRGRTVLLVTHVTPVKTLVRLALGAPPESLFRMELSAASLSAIAYYADGNASLRLLNDTGHLR
ncbi:bifunctional RNase H/acid phosphatase [Streptomyces himalayensis]|uniref:Bifunctional RNase H/acid phosphatase n=1 Tax=Streptomyces himalayensis subsp. himalayensis TaxID=2756131 RepID=A0A7W0DP82_9ACTN|nr:bifunctional RNase H/acid phosphatase [Streptomyces himalayensis]MBA2948747.1 bifunctional RNase H/acid phosphatase [Streptomyces himalayensis subsp. himalayensis]